MGQRNHTFLFSALILACSSAGCGGDNDPIQPPLEEPHQIAAVEFSQFTEARGLAFDGNHLRALARDVQDGTFKIFCVTNRGEVLLTLPAPLEHLVLYCSGVGLGWPVPLER